MSLKDNEYQIIVRLTFNEMDDISAKEKAQKVLNEMNIPDKVDIKLQRLEQSKPPIGIKFVKGHTSGG